MQPLTLRSFARAIVHIDADAFFASCEQAVNLKLKGKPVVTGKERGIASAVSYEAKARGVKRGMTIREIKELCPDAIHLPSDYETYSLFSQRMFAIVRHYTSDVEEYSICVSSPFSIALWMAYTLVVGQARITRRNHRA